eukprot:755317-Hanusia_phi.AAC.6
MEKQTCTKHSYEEVDDLVWVCTTCGHVLPAQNLIGESDGANAHVPETFDHLASNKYGLHRASVNRLNAPSIVEELCHKLRVHNRNLVEQSVSLMEQYESGCCLLRAVRILQSLTWLHTMRGFVAAGDQILNRGDGCLELEEEDTFVLKKEWKHVKDAILGPISYCQAYIRSVPRLNSALMKEEGLGIRSFSDSSRADLPHMRIGECKELCRKYARRMVDDVCTNVSSVVHKFLDFNRNEVK